MSWLVASSSSRGHLVPDEEPPPPEPRRITVANSQITSSGDDGVNVAVNVNDNNRDTRWTASGAGQWVQFDLLAPTSVGGVAVACNRGLERIDYFDILVSDDGITWKPVLHAAMPGNTTELVTFNFPVQAVRYVRLVGQTNNTDQTWNGITEIHLYTTDGVTLPLTPTNFSAVNSNLSARLSWTVPFGPTGHEIAIERAQASGGPWQQIAVVDGMAVAYTDENLTAGTYWYRVLAVGSEGNSAPTAADDAVIGSTPPVTNRLGVFVSQGELDEWARRYKNGPYRVKGDSGYDPNTPGDATRITQWKNKFMNAPRTFEWLGPTYNWPNTFLNQSGLPRDTTNRPNKRDDTQAISPIRDAAFWAMVNGSVHLSNPEITATARDTVLSEVRTSLLNQARSQYLDWTYVNGSGKKRFDPNNVGNAFAPMYEIAMWMVIVGFTYDYSQVANPNLWTTAQKTEFLTWYNNAADWFMGMIYMRRDGTFTYSTWDAPEAAAGVTNDGNSTSQAAGPMPVIWHGGPQARKVNSRTDNHYDAIGTLPPMIGVLLEVEQNRSGISVASAARINSLKNFGKLVIRDYLVAECIASAGGTGGGQRSASGNMYRWNDPPPINGWKYSLEHLGHVITIADMLARGGDFWGFNYSTTSGSAISGGQMAATTANPNGGTKNLLRATRAMLEFIDENSTPVRYGHGSNTGEAYRIDSRDHINNIMRVQDWDAFHGNVYWKDPYIKSVYMRSRPGTPPIPADPHSGQYLIDNGDRGIFPGVHLMRAQMEGLVWPYPSA